ncbi:hypothetical protein ScPMuIL_005871 [Solemya velum]
MALTDGPASLECINKCELFPKKSLISEDESLQVPFPLLSGESVEYLGYTSDGVVALSNFRLLIRFKDSFINIPLGLVESVETRDIFYLNVYCKDATAIRCAFSTNESCQDWFKRIHGKITPPKEISDVFAFAFYAWCLDCSPNATELEGCYQLCQIDDAFHYSFGTEIDRMKFDLKNAWRITYINEDFVLCSSYPRNHIVPAWITDSNLGNVASFRALQRFPSVVWRDQRNGAVLVRCSQPELGWLGWRNAEDESLLQAIPTACSLNGGTSSKSSSNQEDSSSSETSSQTGDATSSENGPVNTKRLLIIDCRSYGAAFANRAKGGGCECAEYYPNCEIQFMNLANIHSIRKSFLALRTLCSGGPDQVSWLSGLETTKWTQYLGSILRAACVVVSAVDLEGRSVLVHCSDGWDRTSQIIALSELLLDPFYRTIEGFQILIEREWLEFGHKFADRCGNGTDSNDPNERCPVFLQWLDCVYQVYKQFPCAFEFNEAYLVKLVQHTYSCLFGTFLCNTVQERLKHSVSKRTASVWSLLKRSNKKFRNSFYCPSADPQVLYPSHHLRSLTLWNSVYLSNNSSSTFSEESYAPLEDISPKSECEQAPNSLQKTRSCENLAAQEHMPSPSRRMSDPNIISDMHDQSNLLNKENQTNGIGEDVTKRNISILNGHQEPPLTNGERVTEEIELLKLNNINWSEKILQKNEIGEPNMSLTENDLPNCEPSERTLTNGFHCNVSDDDDEDSSNELQKTSSEKTLSNKSTCSDQYNPAIDSSTDTLIDDEAKELSRMGSKTSLDNDSSLNGKEGGSDTHTSSEKSLLNRFQSLEASSSISTSTSDISDSHISPDSKARKVLGRELKLQCLLAQSMALRNGCSKSVGGMNGSLPSTPQNPTSSSSRTTPNSTCPPTPGTDAGKSNDSSIQRQLSGIGRHLDYDGLTTFNESLQQRMSQMQSEYEKEIEILRSHLQAATTALLTHASNCTGAGKCILEAKDEILSIPESNGSTEMHSLGNMSNCASDISWEQLDERDTKMTLWVPDHAVTHCAACECGFWLGRRKHHCRNCGKVFCYECTNNFIPLPHQHLYNPERVCIVCFRALRQQTGKTVENVAIEEALISI